MQESAQLRLVESDGQVRDIPLAPGVTTIGESRDNHIVLTGPRVASRHAQLLCDARSCRLVDLGSSSGTSVNGRLVSPNLARRLQPGDVIEIGDYRLHYEEAGEPQSRRLSERLGERISPAPLDLRPASDTREVPSMSGRYRSQRVFLWIIGAMGVIAAVGLVAILAWVFFFAPRQGADPTPLPTIQAATPTVMALATDTPAPPSPTATLVAPATATSTATIPLPSSTTGALTPATTMVAEAATATPAPTDTSTSIPTVQPTQTSTFIPTRFPTATILFPPTWTPMAPTATPSPWGMVNASTANVRAGPSNQYPVIAQVFYGQYMLLLGQSAGYDWLYGQLQDGRLGWIAAYLISRATGLALPIVPAPPLPPTAPPPPPTTTPTPWVPTWTPVPPPTSTFTPVPPPTATLTPVPPCPIAIGAPFISPWTGEVRNTLGCPTDVMRETWTAVQPFERGVMLWREDQRMIYVIANDHTWRKIADNWLEGMDEYSCPDVTPAGLVKPKRGFGYVWCNAAGIKSLVGWGLEEEHGFTTVFQSFAGGEMMRAENTSIWVLLHSGWWQSYP